MLEIKSELEDLAEFVDKVDRGEVKTIPWTTKLLGLERLFKLAEHGKSGKLIQDKFDFDNCHKVFQEKTGNCHTAGCFLGECPGIFEEWIYDRDDLPCLETMALNDIRPSSNSAKEFFILNEAEFRHVFVNDYQDHNFSHEKYVVLDIMASREAVADNMFDFIQFKMREIKGQLEQKIISDYPEYWAELISKLP